MYCMLYVGVGWVPAVFEDLTNTISQPPMVRHALGSCKTAPRERAKSDTVYHVLTRVPVGRPDFAFR